MGKMTLKRTRTKTTGKGGKNYLTTLLRSSSPPFSSLSSTTSALEMPFSYGPYMGPSAIELTPPQDSWRTSSVISTNSDDLNFDSGISSSENYSPEYCTSPNLSPNNWFYAEPLVKKLKIEDDYSHGSSPLITSSKSLLSTELASNPLVAPKLNALLPQNSMSTSAHLVTEEATLGDHMTPTNTENFVHYQNALKALIEQRKESSTTSSPLVSKKMPHTELEMKRIIRKSPNGKLGQQQTQSLLDSRKLSPGKKSSIYTNYPSKSKDGKIELKILAQPEEQHRARYLTEGSRGAVKDRKGTGFPVVKLFGYEKPVTLQVFIGNDQGKPQPHLFYQASKVCGKYATPCTQKKLDGTVVLEIKMLPDQEMTVSCDCVGILKERNVDVEQRLVHFGGTRNKKRSPRCRLVFRVEVPTLGGGTETLQIASAPILCTQPPGIPEISKKSLTSCPSRGNVELFIIGKNFLKDTKVVFKECSEDGNSEFLSSDSSDCIWQAEALPEKEYLHPTHLVCQVPPYKDPSLSSPVTVQLLVTSSGKSSEPHLFTYTPSQPSALEPYPEKHSAPPTLLPKTEQNKTNRGSALIHLPVASTSIMTIVLPSSLIASSTARTISSSSSSSSSLVTPPPPQTSLVMIHSPSMKNEPPSTLSSLKDLLQPSPSQLVGCTFSASTSSSTSTFLQSPSVVSSSFIESPSFLESASTTAPSFLEPQSMEQVPSSEAPHFLESPAVSVLLEPLQTPASQPAAPIPQPQSSFLAKPATLDNVTDRDLAQKNGEQLSVFSQMADSELLRVINPSAFDNM